MSRIGNKPVALPTTVTLSVAEDVVTVKGPKGELTVGLFPGIIVEVIDQEVKISRTNDERQTKAFHGLVRSMIKNTIEGVNKGYRKTMQLIGTGYRVAAKGQGLNLALGFSHPVAFEPVKGILFTVEGSDIIHIDGIDKHMVGQVAANLRKIRPPEPYKGKGIRYKDEVIKLKPGKAAAK